MNPEIEESVPSRSMTAYSVAIGLTAFVLAGLAWFAYVSLQRSEQTERRNLRLDGRVERSAVWTRSSRCPRAWPP